MIQQLDATEFIETIKKAPAWAMIQSLAYERLFLAVAEEDDWDERKYYLGPNYLEMKDIEVVAFISELHEVLSDPDITRNRKR